MNATSAEVWRWAYERERAEVERLEKIEAALAKTADGVTIVPNMAVYCRGRDGSLIKHILVSVAGPGDRDYTHCYADAAKVPKGEP